MSKLTEMETNIPDSIPTSPEMPNIPEPECPLDIVDHKSALIGDSLDAPVIPINKSK